MIKYNDFVKNPVFDTEGVIKAGSYYVHLKSFTIERQEGTDVFIDDIISRRNNRVGPVSLTVSWVEMSDEENG